MIKFTSGMKKNKGDDVKMCSFDAIGNIVERAIANGNNEHCEVIMGPVVPYFDFDKEIEIDDNFDEDEVKNEFITTIMNGLTKVYGHSAEIYSFDGSRESEKHENTFKLSFHILIRGVGYYESGKHLLHSIPDKIKQLPGFDKTVYKTADACQKFKLPYCHKPDVDQDMVRCVMTDGEVSQYEDLEEALENLDEQFSDWCVTNIEGEELKTVEIPQASLPVIYTGDLNPEVKTQNGAPSLEEVQKLIDMLKPERAGPHNDRINVVWCLRNIQDTYGLRTKTLACTFMMKDMFEFSVEKLDEHFDRAKGGNGFNIAWLKQEAKKDNPDEYAKLYASLRVEAKTTYYDVDELSLITNNRSATVEMVEDYLRGCIVRIHAAGGFYMARRKEGWENVGKQPFFGDTNYDVYYTNEKGKEKTIGWCAILKKLLVKDIFKANLYNGVTFEPSFIGMPETSGKFNLFAGFPIKVPAEIQANDHLQTILYHIREVFCDNFEPMYIYFLNWLSHMVQVPQEKVGVAIVIQSEQGVGKNLFWETLAKYMLGDEYYLTISDLDTLLNGFNKLQRNKLLIHLDEMDMFGGSVATANRMKSIITRNKITITEKGKDSYEVPCVARYVISSNCDIPVRVENSDRRFAVTRASSKHKGDKEYFKKLRIAMENGMGDFVRYLLDRDISQWNRIDEIPETKVRIEMKESVISPSLRYMLAIAKLRAPFEKYGREQLHEVNEETDEVTMPEIRMKGADLYDEYVTYSTENKEVIAPRTTFTRDLKKIHLEQKNWKMKGSKTQLWGYKLSIEIIREGFRQHFNKQDYDFDSE